MNFISIDFSYFIIHNNKKNNFCNLNVWRYSVSKANSWLNYMSLGLVTIYNVYIYFTVPVAVPNFETLWLAAKSDSGVYKSTYYFVTRPVAALFFTKQLHFLSRLPCTLNSIPSSNIPSVSSEYLTPRIQLYSPSSNICSHWFFLAN